MPVLTKLTREEFERREEESCSDNVAPVVRVFPGNAPVTLTFKDYDLPIAAGTYKSLVFVPCELIGEFNWIRGFSSRYVVGLTKSAHNEYKIDPKGPRIARHYTPGDYKIIELENNGVLFAFV